MPLNLTDDIGILTPKKLGLTDDIGILDSPSFADNVGTLTKQTYQSFGLGAGDVMTGVASSIENAPVTPPPYMTLSETQAWKNRSPEMVEAVKRGDRIGPNEASENLYGLAKNYPEIQGEMPFGLVGQAVTGVARSAAPMIATAINPPAGVAATIASIKGNKYNQYIKEGKDEKTANDAADLSALLTAPVEFAGNLIPIKSLTKLVEKSKVGATVGEYITEVFKSAIGEGVEELTQTQLDVIADQYANNPDADPIELGKNVGKQIWTVEHAKQSGTAALVGAIGGGGLTGTLGAPAMIPGQKSTQPEVTPDINRQAILAAIKQDFDAGNLTPEIIAAIKQQLPGLAADIDKLTAKPDEVIELRDRILAKEQEVGRTLTEDEVIELQKPIPEPAKEIVQLDNEEPIQPQMAPPKVDIKGLTQDLLAGSPAIDSKLNDAMNKLMAEKVNPPTKVQRSSQEAGENTMYEIMEGPQKGSSLSRGALTQTPEKYAVDESLMPSVAKQANVNINDAMAKELEKAQARKAVKKESEGLTVGKLNKQVVQYTGTGGIASEARKANFLPAFRDNETGKVYPSLQEFSGKPSGVHDIGGLPAELVTKKNEYGDVTEVKGTIEAGFTKDGKFYTREEAVKAQQPKTPLPTEPTTKQGKLTEKPALAAEPAKEGKPKEAPEYVYHGTSEGAFRRIRTEGLKKQKDGIPIYFADKESYATTYAERKGNKATGLRVLRIKTPKHAIEDADIQERGDYKTLENIPPQDIEIKVDGKWMPIQEYYNEDQNIMPISQPAPAEKGEGKPKRGQDPKYSRDFRDWVRRTGGLNPQDKDYGTYLKEQAYTVDAQGKKKLAPGWGYLWNKKAIGIDERVSQAIEHGWLPEGSTEQDFIDMLMSNPSAKNKVSTIGKGNIDVDIETEGEYYRERLEDIENGEYTEDEARADEIEVQNDFRAQISEDQEYTATDEDIERIFGPSKVVDQSSFLTEEPEKFTLTPDELSAEDKISIGKRKGEITNVDKKTKAVIPTEKIKPGTSGPQESFFGQQKGETGDLFAPKKQAEEKPAAQDTTPAPKNKPGKVFLEKGGVKPFFEYKEITRGKILNKGKYKVTLTNGKTVIVNKEAIREFPSAQEDTVDKPVFLKEGDISIEAPTVKTLLSKQGVENIIKGIKTKLPNIGNFEVVKTQDELPEFLFKEQERDDSRIYGVYDPQSDTFYLVADNMKNRGAVLNTVIHEAIGHRGVDAILLKSRRKQLFRMVNFEYGKKDIGQKIVKDYGLDLTNETDQVTFAREVIAHMAVNEPKASLLDRVISMIKSALRELGITLKISDAEIRSLLARSYKFAQTGKGKVDKSAGMAYQMAGVKAQGAPTGNLSKAEELYSQGKTDDSVWKETGWMKDSSGKWTFRIDDSGMKFKRLELDSIGIAEAHRTLEDTIEHDELFNAYPELKNLLVNVMVDKNMQSPRAHYAPFKDRSSEGLFDIEPEISVYAKDINEAKDSLLHEIQHAIQDIEGFSRGGNLSEFETVKVADVEKKKILKKIDDLWGKAPDDFQNEVRVINRELSKKEDGLDYNEDNFNKALDFVEKEYRDLYLEYTNLRSKLYYINRDQDYMGELRPLDQYERLAGEISARESGAGFKGVPFTMEGIPRDQWIVKDSDKGTSFSINAPNITDTKEFKDFFGDSKVTVDGKAGSEPLVVYHGTPNGGFDVFNEGSVFTKNKIYADRYQNKGASSISYKKEAINPTTYAVYLSIQKPFDTRDKKAKRIFQEEYEAYYSPNLTERGMVDWLEAGDLAEWIQENHPEYDGLIVDEGSEPKSGISDIDKQYEKTTDILGWRGISYVPFKPEQIKSILNKGTFDKTDKRIMFSKEAKLSPEDYAKNLIARAGKKPEAVKEKAVEKKAKEPKTSNFGMSGMLSNNDKAKQALNKFADKAGYWILDKNMPIAKIQENLKKMTEELDLFLSETQRPKRTAAKIKQMWEDMVTPLLKTMGENQIDLGTLEEYKHAKHARERNEAMRKGNAKRYIEKVIAAAPKETKALQEEIKDLLWPEEWYAKIDSVFDEFRKIEAVKDIEKQWITFQEKPSGMSDKDADKILSFYQKDKAKLAKIEEVGKIVDTINRETIETLYNSGQIADKEYEIYKTQYKNYVPLHREGFEDESQGTGRGLQPAGRLIKTAMGSTRDVVNILAHSITNLENAINRAEKAESAKILLDMVKANPDPDLWTLNKVKETPRHDEAGNLKMYPDSFSVAPNEMRFMVDGEQYLLSMNRNNDNAMRMLKTLKAEDSMGGPLINALSKMNKWLARINTTWSPEFVINNFIRDIQAAGININDTGVESKRMFRGALSAVKSIHAVESGKGDGGEYGKYYERFKAAGGKIGWSDIYGTAEKMSKELSKDIEMFSGKRPVRQVWQKTFKFIEDWNTSVENGVRLHAFKLAVDQGFSDKKAAQIASDLTVDFTKKGAAGPVINSLYLFANAGIQGSYRIFRAGAKSPKVRKIMAGIVGVGILNGLLNAAIGGQDDDGEDYYNKIDDYVKERNWIIMIPNSKGKYLKIPLPWGYNVLWNIGDEISKTVTKEDYKPLQGAGRLLSVFAQAFNPIQSGTLLQTLSPTITDPFAMVAENKNWYGGDLMPQKNVFEKVPTPDSQRYWKTARDTSKWVAEKLNDWTGGNQVRKGAVDVSPETLDLIVDTIGGSAMRFFTDAAATPLKVARGEETTIQDYPFIRRAAGEKSQYADQRTYYENLTEVLTAKEELEAYKGTSYYYDLDQKLKDMKRMIPLAENSERRLRKLRKIRNRSENKAQVDNLNKQIEQIYIDFNKKYYRIK